jgi:Dyp-type peroxidase family
MGFLREYEASFAADARRAVLRKWIGLRRQDLFKELREQQPIFETPDFFLVTRHQDVVEVFSHEDFSVEPYREAGTTNFVLGLDNPEHDPVRARLEQTLQWTQKQLTQDEPFIRQSAARAAAQVIDAAQPHGQLDLPAQFGRRVPLQVVADYFGVPDVERVGNWTRDLFRAFFYTTFAQYVAPNPLAGTLVKEKAEHARQEFGMYVAGLVGRSRPSAPTLIGRMLAAVTPPDIPTIVRNVIGLINGMIDNINVFLTNAMAELLSRPELADAVKAAQDDDIPLLRRYLWEALRFNAYPFALPRKCRTRHVLGAGTSRETPIPAGKRVFAVIGSAMMDEAVMGEPSHFNLERPEEQYLYFGPGSDIHVCVGKALAEMILVEMAKPLLHLEGIRRADGPAGELQYEEGLLKGFTVVFGRQARAGRSKALPSSQLPQPSERVQHPLTAIMTIKQPVEVHANALKQLLAEKFTIVEALLDRVGTVHFARFVFLDNDSKLALITTYDGSFDNYIKNYIELAGELFDAMLVHMEDAPPLPVRQYRQEFIDYVQRVDAASPAFYSAYRTLTVQNIRGQAHTATQDTLDQEPREDTQPPQLDLADIQGLILHDYPVSYVRHFILRVNRVSAARRCIGALLPSGTANDLMITTAASEWPQDAGPEYCLNIGFTYAGLQALQLPETSLDAFAKFKAFAAGAVKRAEVVGDTGPSALAHWIEVLRNPTEVHVLLFLYARNRATLEAKTKQLRALCAQHDAFSELPFPHDIYDGAALPDPDAEKGFPGRIIHFGYRDGISQPAIAGAPPSGFLDGQPPVPAGAFLLGYPSQWRGFRYPVPRPAELGHNGSFAAFRIFKQDVQAFETYLSNQAGDDAGKEAIAAQICGRWRNGVPLVLFPDSPDTKIPKEQWNGFDYADDPAGERCPFDSHMRRTNPRGESERVAGADGHQRRIIRRGMPYGPPYNRDNPEDNIERGLLGLFICASLEDQFEFLMANWINGSGFRPEIPHGSTDPMFRFVTTRGGAYCFLPSLTALKHIANLEAAG